MRSKRTITLIALLSVVIVCVSVLNSCSNKMLRPYNIYVCNMHDFGVPMIDLDTGDVPYNMPRKQYKFQSYPRNRSKDEPNREIMLNDDTISLEFEEGFVQTYCDFYVNSYINSEYGVGAYFREDNGKMVHLRFSDYEYKISDDPITTEKELLDACNNYLIDHVGSLDRYSTEVETLIQKSVDGELRNERVSGFSTDTDGTATYYVSYKYMIDGIVTSDTIYMSVTMDGCLKTVSINRTGEFDKFDECDIDMRRCDKLIAEETEHICNVDGYAYEGYEDSKSLILVDGKLCLLVFVKPIFAEVEEDLLAYDLEMLIPIAK